MMKRTLYLLILFSLLYSSICQNQLRSDDLSGSSDSHRRQQGGLLVELSRFASGLNERIYSGALRTQEVLNRLDESEHNNPDGLFSRSKEIIGKIARPEDATNDGSSSMIDDQATSSSALDQLLQMINKQNDKNGQRLEDENGSQGSSSIADFITEISAMIDTNGTKKQIRSSIEQTPGELNLQSSSARTRPEFEERMNRLAASFIHGTNSPKPTADPAKTSIATETLTLGPIVSQKFDNHDVSPDDSCFLIDTALEGDEFRLKEGVPDVSACSSSCRNSPDCHFFSFASSIHRCYLFEGPTSTRASEGFVSGPSRCTSSGDLPASIPRATSRNLQGLSLSASDYHDQGTYRGCLASRTGLEGRELMVIEGIVSASACQQNCGISDRCQFFSYGEDDQRCRMYDSATGVKARDKTISGPKSCIASADLRGVQESRSAAGPLVAPGQAIPEFNYGQGSDTVGGNTETYIHGQSDNQILHDDYQSSNQGRGGPFGILGGNGGGFLSGLLGEIGLFGQNRKTMEGAGALGSIGGMSRTIQTVMAAGDTVMKTVPIADMVKVGYQLANSGVFNRGPRGGGKVDAAGPPVGVGNPTTTCLSQGMRCCVPRVAAPKYQVEPPRLNDVDSPRCTAIYVTQWDQLCATTEYVDDECGTNVVETSEMFVYRNSMAMPGKSMNNAICECSLSKIGKDTIASGKWEYSLALKEEKEETKLRNQEAMTKLADAAKVAAQWGEALSGRRQMQGGGSASNFLNSMVDLVDGIGGRETNSVEKKPSAQNDLDNLNSAANALLEALEQIRDNKQQNQKNLRKLLEENGIDVTEKTSSSQITSSIPVPVNCSVWNSECETSFERLMFDKSCFKTNVILNGCPRVDVEYELLNATDSSKFPTYRFRVPIVFGLAPLGIACNFISLPMSSVHPTLPSICKTGPFPIPDPPVLVNSSRIRERGPLLEIILTFISESKVMEGLVAASELLQKTYEAVLSNVDSTIEQMPPTFSARDDHSDGADLEALPPPPSSIESLSIGVGKVNDATSLSDYSEVTARRKLEVSGLNEGMEVHLSLNPPLKRHKGETFSTLFNVEKGTNLEEARWGLEIKSPLLSKLQVDVSF